MSYNEIPLKIAYRLINHGPLLLVSSRLKNGRFNIAPVAWNCTYLKEPASLIIAVGKGNATHDAIISEKRFAVSIPCRAQEELVRKTGAVTGEEVDKYKEFSIRSIRGKKTGLLIPEGSTGYIELRLMDVYDTGKVSLILGEAIYSAADPTAFSERVLPAAERGKTLHHLGGNVFAYPVELTVSDTVD